MDESLPTPTPSEPLPRRAKRSWLSWVCLVLVFAAYIEPVVSRSLQRRPPRATNPGTAPNGTSYGDDIGRLRLAVSMRELGFEPYRQTILKGLSDEWSDKPKHTVEDARICVLTRAELNLGLDDEALRILRESSIPLDQTMTSIYSKVYLSQEEMTEYIQPLGERTFVSRLVVVQAREKAGARSGRNVVFDSRLARDYLLRMSLDGALWIGALAIWIVVVRNRRRGEWTPLGAFRGTAFEPPVDLRSDREADGMAARASWMIVIYGVTGAIGYWLPLPSYLFAVVAMLAAIAPISKIRFGGRGFSMEEMGFSFEDFRRNVRWGLIAGIAIYPIQGILSGIGIRLFSFLPPPSHPATQEIYRSSDLGRILWTVFIGSALSPMWEEFVFRGVLFSALGRVTRSYVAGALMSSLLFASIHPQGISEWLSIAFFGFFGCRLASQTRSLVPSVTMHMLTNGLIFLSAMLAAGRL